MCLGGKVCYEIEAIGPKEFEILRKKFANKEFCIHWGVETHGLLRADCKTLLVQWKVKSPSLPKTETEKKQSLRKTVEDIRKKFGQKSIR